MFSLPGLDTFFESVLPLFLEDINLEMNDWGAEGKINPFNEVYDVYASFR